MYDKVVEIFPNLARRLKLYPHTVSVRVKYEDGSIGQWWIEFPTEHMAAHAEEWINKEYIIHG